MARRGDSQPTLPFGNAAAAGGAGAHAVSGGERERPTVPGPAGEPDPAAAAVREATGHGDLAPKADGVEPHGASKAVRGPAAKLLEALYQRLDQTGIDFYRSAMHTHYGWPLRWLSYRFFRHARVDPAALARIRDVAAKGEVVYVMRHRSLLDYLYFNYLYVREGLPLPRFGSEINMLLWMPLARAARTLLAKATWFVRFGFLPDPIDSGWVEQLVSNRAPLLVFLKRRRTWTDLLRRQRPKRDVAEALIAGAAASERPVFLVPQVVFWERRPETGRKTPVDVVFGEADKPRRIRKVVSFLHHHRDGLVSLAEPFDLKAFLREHEGEPVEVTAKKLRWVLLQHIYRERRVVTGARIMPVTQVAKKIHADPVVKSEIERVAAREGKPADAIRTRVDKIVRKMAADLRWNWLMAGAGTLTWVWNNIYSGLEVDQNGIRQVKAILKDHPVVLIPSHRSHADYLILSYVLYHHDMTVPMVAAGDNLSFWPMGTIFRRMGAFFIRRTMKGDALYAAVLERYVKNLVKAGHTLEFFIEGGRSRTGRVLRPKLGLLTMVVRAWEEGASDDVYLSPISMSYEKVIEERDYIRELEGAAKRKESVSGLFRVLKVLSKRYGRVFVEFAEPISLRAALGVDGPTFAAKSDGEKRAAIKALGDHIANGINAVTVVTPSQLTAAALLAHGKRGMLHSSLIEAATFFLDYLRAAGVRRSPALDRDAPAALARAASGFLAEKAIRAGEEGDERYYVLEEDQRISLDFYKNMVLHYFAPASFVCAELAVEAPLARATLLERYRKVRERFRLEFPDVEAGEQELEFEVALASLERAGVVASAESDSIAVTMGGRRRLRLLASLSHSLFESYFAAARGVAGVTDATTEKELTARVAGVAAKMYRNGVLERKEALALPVLANGLKQLLAAKALTRADGPQESPKVKVDEAARRAEEAFWVRYLRL